MALFTTTCFGSIIWFWEVMPSWPAGLERVNAFLIHKFHCRGHSMSMCSSCIQMDISLSMHASTHGTPVAHLDCEKNIEKMNRGNCGTGSCFKKHAGINGSSLFQSERDFFNPQEHVDIIIVSPTQSAHPKLQLYPFPLSTKPSILDTETWRQISSQ